MGASVVLMFILEKNIIPLPQEINNKNERVAIAEIGEGNFFIENLSSDMLACEGREWILNDVFKRICAKEKEGVFVRLDYSYSGCVFSVDLWLNENNTPEQAEIVWQGKRIMLMRISNYEIL